MVRIRLRRVGATNQPSYRVVVTDKRSPRDGRFIEAIGYYNPRTEPSTMSINEERALHWLSNGAQPSDAVRRILKNLGTLDRFERLRAGEALEDLLAEAEAEAAERPEVDPRTRRDDIKPKKGSAEPAVKMAEEVEEEADEEVEEATDEVTEEEVEEEVEEEENGEDDAEDDKKEEDSEEEEE